jgi:hypothetical protein
MKPTRRKKITPQSRLKVGAWYRMNFCDGDYLNTVCVIEIRKDGKILTECPNHLLAHCRLWTPKEMFHGRFKPVFLGYGKPRPIMGRIRRWTNCFGTLYTKP